MALRSGYKGFKKLLGLKTIRPGTLAVDDAALANTFFPRSEQAVLGAKNILKNDGAPSQSRANTSWTKNTDGSVTVSTTGSASEDSDYHLNNSTSRPISEIKNGMIMTAVEHAGDSYDAFNSKFYLCIIYRNSSDGYISQQSCVDGPVTLNIPDNAAYYRMSVAVYTGAEIDNVTVYPMISFDGGDYAPYAMTNEELTEKVTPLGTSDNYVTTGSISVPNNTATEIASLTLPAGKYLLSGIYCANAASQEYDVMLNISNGDSPTSGREEIVSGKVTTFAQAGIQLIKYVELGSQRTYKLFVKHNAGDAVTVYPAFRAIRVG